MEAKKTYFETSNEDISSAEYVEDTERRKKKKKKKRGQQQASQPSRQKTTQENETQAKADKKRGSFLRALFSAEEKKPQPKREANERLAAASGVEDKEQVGESGEGLTPAERREAVEEYIRRRRQILELKADEQVENREPNEHSETNARASTVIKAASLSFLRRLADKLRKTESSPDEEMYQSAVAETIEDDEAFVATHEQAEQLNTVKTQVEDREPTPDESPQSSQVHTSAPHPIMPMATHDTMAGPQPNYENTQDRGNLNSVEVKSTERNTASGGEFLLGGFLGYLLGRRHGRLKTEAQEGANRQSLERDIKELESTIYTYEKQVQSAALQRERIPPPPVHKEVVSVESSRQESSPRHSELIVAEAQPLKIKSPPEVMLSRSQPRETGPTIRPASEQVPVTAESLKSAPLKEVLVVAQDIKTSEGSWLATKFEQKLINESALREVVKVYLQGGNYEKILAQYHEELHSESVEAPGSYPEKKYDPQASAYALPEENQSVVSIKPTHSFAVSRVDSDHESNATHAAAREHQTSLANKSNPIWYAILGALFAATAALLLLLMATIL